VDSNSTAVGPDAVSCEQVVKQFGSGPSATVALRGVDLAISPGDYVAIMGPSGCGKSTLMHLLGGLDVPTAGTVTLAGTRIDRLSETKRAVLRRRTVGFVFQFYNLVANRTVADNVELPMLLAGVAPVAARRRREDLLERLGLAAEAMKSPGALSGGQQQRVALARALANEPAVILADEPTGALDSVASAEVMSLLREANGSGQTIVIVTHDHAVGAQAERIVAMADGKIVADDAKAVSFVPADSTLSEP
jgi:putative ABC transport system ATP-binding protein